MEHVDAAAAHAQVADCDGTLFGHRPMLEPPPMSRTAAAARRDLARIVGEGAVRIPVADRSLLHDSTETRGLSGDALGAVFPGSTGEVAEVVRWCARTGVPFVPRGRRHGVRRRRGARTPARS